jgi:singapore isolate B (sub-type 7) whole genome shotgun sequence assembly, scaffold_0
VLDIFPNTKQALRRCTQRRKCGRFRPFDRLHDYFFMRWYSLAYNDLLTPVTCFKSDTQEPYVVVRKSPDLPRFDERFVNYAYNKVQWIEHLRYRGYRFSVLTMGFAVDMPHPL